MFAIVSGGREEASFMKKSGVIAEAPKLSHFEKFGGIFFPLSMISGTQKIFVIGKKLVEAGFGNVEELDFGFSGRRGCGTTFNNILFSGARGLNHLINRAIVFPEKILTKIKGKVVNALRLLKADQFSVISPMRDKILGHKKRYLRRLRTLTSLGSLSSLKMSRDKKTFPRKKSRERFSLISNLSISD